jgi:transposase
MRLKSEDENHGHERICPNIRSSLAATSCQRILAVVLYSLLYGGISMRNLQRELAVRADLLYLSGGMSIDHTTFSVFRKRHREAILKLFWPFFAEMLLTF